MSAITTRIDPLADFRLSLARLDGFKGNSRHASFFASELAKLADMSPADVLDCVQSEADYYLDDKLFKRGELEAYLRLPWHYSRDGEVEIWILRREGWVDGLAEVLGVTE